MMPEILAAWQEALPDQKVRCLLCPHHCLLPDGRTGLCKTRINRAGRLFSTSYGKLCALGVDPIEKKPLYHFYPGSGILSLATAGCTFRCLNCQNWTLSQQPPEAVPWRAHTPEEVVEKALFEGVDSLAFTYTEPTVFYEFMLDTARLAKARGLRTVLISNGYLNQAPLEALCEVIDAANIDLKAFDEATHLRLTGGRLQPVIDTLNTLKSRGVWLELTQLIIPGMVDDPSVAELFFRQLVGQGHADTPLHLSRFFPQYKLTDRQATPIETLEALEQVARSAGFKYVYLGNVQDKGGEDTRCPTCGQLVVGRRGYLVHTYRLNDGRCPHCGASIAGCWP
jgi:pyruvate formate lyase activating enzyme